MSLSEMIANSAIAAVISNPRLPDNPIVECNEAFIALTGYTRDEIVGRNCRFLSGPDTEPWLSETIRAGVRERRPVLVEILNYRKDGTPFRNAVMVAPIFGVDGELDYFLGSQMAVESPDATGAERSSGARERIAALTSRQRDVLIAMAAGKLNKQIAHDLAVSEATIKTHMTAIMRKLDVQNRTQAALVARSLGLDLKH